MYPPLMHLRRCAAPSSRSTPRRRDPRRRERGQALVLFALLSLVMIGSVAIVTDISWLWYGNQRMQRAADAAALAGAIYLPGNPTSPTPRRVPRRPRTATPTGSTASP